MAINRGVFYDNTVMHIAAKTGYGKSLILLTIGLIRKGITVIQVPLIGLGSDQVAKAMFVNRRIEAYHIDEH